MALTYTFTSLIPLKPLFPHITNPTKPISLYPKTSTKPHHIAFQAQHNPGSPEELFAEVDILDEGYVPWEGAVVYKRSARGAHLEFCTTLERLGLGKLESEVSLRRAGVMGLRGGKDRDGTPVMVSVDVGPRKKRKGVRLDGVVRTVITLDCNRRYAVPPPLRSTQQFLEQCYEAPYPNRSVDGGSSGGSLKSCSFKEAYDCQLSVLKLDESLSPASLDSGVIGDRDGKNERYPNASHVNSVDCLEAEQLMQDARCQEHDNDCKVTPYVPVYVLLSPSIINNFCQLVDREGIREELNTLVSLNADGVAVNCWWGMVECWSPQKYVWSGYRELLNIIKEFKMKVQVIMAFHEHLDNDNSDVLIRLPQWVLEIGRENPDIFFTDREGRRNTDCLSWGIDKERALKGRTGVEVYFDFMRSFRTEFDDLFAEGVFSAVEIGLGASGELKYPSFPERMGWRYPGIENLRKAAKLRGHSFWARGPDNAGQYNSRPYETGFFCERGDYDSYYGRFFLQWYSQLLIDHADNVLSLASLAFEEIKMIVKIPAIYWWYRTVSHAAELTAGYYNPSNQDGYSRVFEILQKHSVMMKFMGTGLYVDNGEALADPEGLSWQVVNSAWDRGLTTAGENAVSHYHKDDYVKMVDMAKPRTDPDHHHFCFFVYRHPSPAQRTVSLPELDFLIKRMHGEIDGNLGP